MANALKIAKSRIARNPIAIPNGVELKVEGKVINIKGSKGSISYNLPTIVDVVLEGKSVQVVPADESNSANASSGTVGALLKNMLQGVAQGYERKLILVGVGYRAQMKGKALALTVGFSHPVEYDPPVGITIETPSQTEVIVKGVNKQLVGQVAAVIRRVRPPEPYKGKGIRYADEQITLKETKKK